MYDGADSEDDFYNTDAVVPLKAPGEADHASASAEGRFSMPFSSGDEASGTEQGLLARRQRQREKLAAVNSEANGAAERLRLARERALKLLATDLAAHESKRKRASRPEHIDKDRHLNLLWAGSAPGTPTGHVSSRQRKAQQESKSTPDLRPNSAKSRGSKGAVVSGFDSRNRSKSQQEGRDYPGRLKHVTGSGTFVEDRYDTKYKYEGPKDKTPKIPDMDKLAQYPGFIHEGDEQCVVS